MFFKIIGVQWEGIMKFTVWHEFQPVVAKTKSELTSALTSECAVIIYAGDELGEMGKKHTTCIGFVNRKEYNIKNDWIAYKDAIIKLTPEHRCPVCRQRVEKDMLFAMCKNCGSIYSFMTPVNKARLDKM